MFLDILSSPIHCCQESLIKVELQQTMQPCLWKIAATIRQLAAGRSLGFFTFVALGDPGKAWRHPFQMSSHLNRRVMKA